MNNIGDEYHVFFECSNANIANVEMIPRRLEQNRSIYYDFTTMAETQEQIKYNLIPSITQL